jgi:hypothetical protein
VAGSRLHSRVCPTQLNTRGQQIYHRQLTMSGDSTMHATRRQEGATALLRHLPAEQNLADQHIPQPAGGLPERRDGNGEPDEGVGGSQDAGKRCQQQRYSQPA